MTRNLTDADVDALANAVVERLCRRISGNTHNAPQPPPGHAPVVKPPASVAEKLPDKLSFNIKELSIALGISKMSIYRLEARGLLKSLPHFRTKIYPRREVERFLEG